MDLIKDRCNKCPSPDWTPHSNDQIWWCPRCGFYGRDRNIQPLRSQFEEALRADPEVLKARLTCA